MKRVRSRFQKGLFKYVYSGVAKMVTKNLQKFASELGFQLGVMGGFQKDITHRGTISGSFHTVGLQKWVAKNLQNFCI